MLSVDPKMLTRLDELEEDLIARRSRANEEGWRGEVGTRSHPELPARQKVSDPPGTANWRTRPRRTGHAACEGQGTTASRTAATHTVSSPGAVVAAPEWELDHPGLGRIEASLPE